MVTRVNLPGQRTGELGQLSKLEANESCSFLLFSFVNTPPIFLPPTPTSPQDHYRITAL